MTSSVQYEFKRANEVKDIVIDFSEFMQSGDTITGTPTWTFPSGITKDSQSNTTTTATAVTSGGTADTSYTLVCLAVTTNGETLELSRLVLVQEPVSVSTAYADHLDVEGLINVSYTQPTSGEVDAWCVRYSNTANAALKKAGYTTVPATGSNDIFMLQNAVTQGVGALVWGIAFVNNDPPHVQAWREYWASFIEDLARGNLFLEDQSPNFGFQVMTPKEVGVD